MNKVMKYTIGCLGALLALSSLSQADQAPAVSLFDGKSLQGWKVLNEQNAAYWSVKDGEILCSSGGEKMPRNTYLYTEKEYGDFMFTCKFRLSGDPATGLINSGIQYRSALGKKGPHNIIIGYQADIGKDWWGGIFDEHRRKVIYRAKPEALLASNRFKDDNWHTYCIICKGNHHRLYINGILTADYLELDQDIPAKGIIALQLHGGGICQIQWKDLTIKPL